MNKLLASTCLTFGLLGGASLAHADCGTVTVASMNWQSAEVLAAVDQLILSNGYGCTVEIVSGDTVPTITSMVERGSPDVAPESWVDLVPEVFQRGMDEGSVVTAAKSLSDGGVQGWWIPKYIADANPDIKTIDDVLARPDLFPDPEDPSKGAIHNGPAGWGGTVVTAQYYKAYGAEEAGFTLVDTGSSAGLDGSVARAYEREQGWVGYYWAPTALLGRYEMVKLDAGAPHDEAEWQRCNVVADCPDPKKNEWPTDTVYTLLTSSFAERADDAVLEYFNKRAWSNDTVNRLMAWMTDNQATGDDGAKYFLQNNEDLWSQWVSPEAVEKIKAAL